MYHRAVSNRKKNSIPLSKLRASDAVKTVVDHPRRMEELLRMLEDRDRSVRGRAAVALAQLSESHPARLLRVFARLRDMMADESAYVRWHLFYALGKLGSKYPLSSCDYLPDLISRLDDDNRICRVMAVRALGLIASQRPKLVEESFQNSKREIPSAISKILHRS